jgi:cell division protein FtsZ
VRVTVIAAGFGEANNTRARPAKLTTGQGTGDAALRPSPFPVGTEPVADPGELAGPLAEAAAVAADAGTSAPYGAVTTGPDTATPYGAVTAGRAMAAAAASRKADTNGASAPRAGGTNGGPPPRTADADGAPPPRAAQEPPRPRPDTASAARVFDAATTRRRSVVFEEDDELDVPDFLK